MRENGGGETEKCWHRERKERNRSERKCGIECPFEKRERREI